MEGEEGHIPEGPFKMHAGMQPLDSMVGEVEALSGEQSRTVGVDDWWKGCEVVGTS